MQHFVVGIDPSLSRTGVAICPLDWGGDWSKVRTLGVESKPLGKSPSDRMRRCEALVEGVCAGLRGLGELVKLSVFIEDYAFSKANRAHHIGELGGVFRSKIGIEREVGIGTARKRLLGKAPRDGAKVAVYEAFRAAGARSFLSLDESDAMCVCNYGLSELGGFFYGVPG